MSTDDLKKKYQAYKSGTLKVTGLEGASEAEEKNFIEAFGFLEKERYKDAIKILEPLAKKGYPGAMYNLALCYKDGLGVWKNPKKAFELFFKAAQQGDVQMQRSLALCYEDGIGVKKDTSKAIEWYKKTAAQGEVKSLVNLLWLRAEYEDDNDDFDEGAYKLNKEKIDNAILLMKKEKYKEVFPVLKELAEQGFAEAQYELADCYGFGTGVEEDREKYYEWACIAALGLRKMAKKGYVNAQNFLGQAYLTGKGVPKDNAKSFEWLNKAALQGSTDAQCHLGSYSFYYEDGFLTRKKAAQWYIKSAQQGNVGAQYSIGLDYEIGRGTMPQDTAKAIEWYTKAAAAADYSSISFLARRNLYQLKGVKHVPRDDSPSSPPIEIIIYKSGAMYEGETAGGQRSGKGKLTELDDRNLSWNVYEGDWFNDRKHGKGKYTYSNGAVYEGDYLNDKRTGKGKYTSKSGTIYEGDFVNGNFNGKGKYTWTNGGVYEGDFVDDEFHGKAKRTWTDGKVYVGEFANGKRNGKGKLTYPDGKVEEGNWKDGEFAGK